MSGGRPLYRRVADSVAFRSGPVYQRILRHWPARALAKPVAPELRVITMSGRNHVLLLEQMLATLAASWTELPSIHLLSDGTLRESDVAAVRRRYAGPITVVESAALEAHHAARARPELVRFCRENYFGRKLAFIMGAADEHPSLWVDNDVLFFGDFSADLRRLAGRAPLIGATRDASFGKTERFFGYDVPLAEHLFAGQPEAAAVNAGFTFANGPVYDTLQLAAVVRHALAGAHGYLTEQTIVAHAVRQSGGILWDAQTVYLDDKDMNTLGPTYRRQPWRARHYTGNVRHLFWRDAFYRRFDRN